MGCLDHLTHEWFRANGFGLTDTKTGRRERCIGSEIYEPNQRTNDPERFIMVVEPVEQGRDSDLGPNAWRLWFWRKDPINFMFVRYVYHQIEIETIYTAITGRPYHPGRQYVECKTSD